MRSFWMGFLLLLASLALAEEPAPQAKVDSGKRPSVTIGPVSKGLSTVLAKLKAGDPRWADVVAIRVATDLPETDVPALLGTSELSGDRVVFRPKYPLQGGQSYSILVDASSLDSKFKPVRIRFTVPRPDAKPTARVEQIYPTADRLPENHLRFYIAFSAPMSIGDAYSHLRLVEVDGKPVDEPFLELTEEMWDADRKRLTLLIHPGRIKRGLRSREEAGPALVAGRKYVLEVDRRWLDGEGVPLREAFRKEFTVDAANEKPLDQAQWKLSSPAAATTDPLVVKFPLPLDRALLERMLGISGPDGRQIAGMIQIDDRETRWTFRPKSAWTGDEYHLTVDTALEDPCGNRIGRAFDLDLNAGAPPRKQTRETVEIPFRPKGR